MNLNLGAGDDRRDGYLSVDYRPEVSDVVADVSQLPFRNECVHTILAFDILEHLPPSATMPTLLEWRRVLVPSGRLVLRIPNVYQLGRGLAAYYELGDHTAVEMYVANLYGGHRWGPAGAWDRHEWGWTPAGIERALRGAGFEVISNDESLNQTLVARKSRDDEVLGEGRLGG